LKVVPGPLGATAMTKVDTVSDFDVNLVFIVRFALSWLFAEGAFLDHHVLRLLSETEMVRHIVSQAEVDYI
jgi:hypothetical protein